MAERVFRRENFDEIEEARKTVKGLYDADMISTATYERAIEEIGFRLSESLADGVRS
jgi:hypothetical protein